MSSTIHGRQLAGTMSAKAAPPAWFEELMRGFFRYLLVRRNRSPKTVYVYGHMLRDFARSIDAAGVHGLADIRRQHVDSWQDALAERGAAQRSQHVAAAALKGLLKWTAASEIDGASPTLWMHIILPSLPEFEPRPLRTVDLERLEDHLAEPTEDEALGDLRRRALFWLLLSSGSRIGAVLALNRTAIRDGTAEIIQKGRRRHTLVLSDVAVAAIATYLERRTDDDEALFVGPRAKRRLARQEANRDLAELAHQAGVPSFTAHRLRHTCATMMRRNGADIVLVAKHLGHRGLQTVQGYSDVNLDERRAAVALLYPAAELPTGALPHAFE